MSFDFKLKPLAGTTIGSMPFSDVNEAVELMGALDIPVAAQMVAVSPWEDMLLSAVDGLAGLLVDEPGRKVGARRHGREDELALFYDRFLSGDFSFLARPEKSSLGLKAMLDKARADKSYGPDFLKSQTVGPLTFGQMVSMDDGEGALVDDQELLEMAAQALGGKAAWEAALIRETGRGAIVFLDEPGLSGYGSAFSTLSPERVIETMDQAAEVARSKGPALIGCHVCGNTDWGLLAKTSLDIINPDCYGFLDTFVLYPRELTAFFKRGGRVAWGIVPAQGFDASITAEALANKLREGWMTLDKAGLDFDLIRSRALLSSACGLGSLTADQARAIIKMIPEVGERLAAM